MKAAAQTECVHDWDHFAMPPKCRKCGYEAPMVNAPKAPAKRKKKARTKRR